MITAGALKCFLGVGGEYFWLKRNMSISSLEGRTQEEQKEKKKTHNEAVRLSSQQETHSCGV